MATMSFTICSFTSPTVTSATAPTIRVRSRTCAVSGRRRRGRRRRDTERRAPPPGRRGRSSRRCRASGDQPAKGLHACQIPIGGKVRGALARAFVEQPANRQRELSPGAQIGRHDTDELSKEFSEPAFLFLRDRKGTDVVASTRAPERDNRAGRGVMLFGGPKPCPEEMRVWKYSPQQLVMNFVDWRVDGICDPSRRPRRCREPRCRRSERSDTSRSRERASRRWPDARAERRACCEARLGRTVPDPEREHARHPRSNQEPGRGHVLTDTGRGRKFRHSGGGRRWRSHCVHPASSTRARFPRSTPARATTPRPRSPGRARPPEPELRADRRRSGRARSARAQDDLGALGALQPARDDDARFRRRRPRPTCRREREKGSTTLATRLWRSVPADRPAPLLPQALRAGRGAHRSTQAEEGGSGKGDEGTRAGGGATGRDVRKRNAERSTNQDACTSRTACGAGRRQGAPDVPQIRLRPARSPAASLRALQTRTRLQRPSTLELLILT